MLSNKEKAKATYEAIRKRQEKRDKIADDTHLLMVEQCMKRSAYCATRKYNSRVGQI